MVLSRMRARRGGDFDDFVVTEDLVAHHLDHLEPPTPDEGPLALVR